MTSFKFVTHFNILCRVSGGGRSNIGGMHHGSKAVLYPKLPQARERGICPSAHVAAFTTKPLLFQFQMQIKLKCSIYRLTRRKKRNI